MSPAVARVIVSIADFVEHTRGRPWPSGSGPPAVDADHYFTSLRAYSLKGLCMTGRIEGDASGSMAA